jgi:hypothetical protein
MKTNAELALSDTLLTQHQWCLRQADFQGNFRSCIRAVEDITVAKYAVYQTLLISRRIGTEFETKFRLYCNSWVHTVCYRFITLIKGHKSRATVPLIHNRVTMYEFSLQ